MREYQHQALEAKWRQRWQDQELYKAENSQDKPKYYVLDMFPYPSGAGLHVGHPKGYIATDVVTRCMMMRGFNVLHPMGWDAFGLPAENYALKTGTHPSISTAEHIVNYKRQLDEIGLAYDWSREINTTDPAYYKWTQWAFLEMFKRGLVYESHEPINWCPVDKTGLANEDIENGRCERCGSLVEKRPLRQWGIRITDYADRLLTDLDKLPDWEDSIKEMQRHWIGRSEGASVIFAIVDSPYTIEVFTTRPDTLFGATYLVVAPDHGIIAKLQSVISNWTEVQAYADSVKNKSDLERTDLNKEKTGVELQGVKAIHPVTGHELPVYAADYVLSGYGTGAIMAVPAHDERDQEFALKYKLPIIKVVLPPALDQSSTIGFNSLPVHHDLRLVADCYTEEGIATNSEFLNGLPTAEAKQKMSAWLEANNVGKSKVQYKLKDWVFSRQRYWGEPIPLIYCRHCADEQQAGNLEPANLGERLNPGWMADDNLPVTLPMVDHYEPSGTEESPLAGMPDWVNVACPRCGSPAKRETNTMPQWAGSSWYYLRYMDAHNDQALVGKSAEQYWSPVDLYVGGAEHATRHLIYARFWHKFLFDIKTVTTEEPFAKLRHVGLILASDGRKMSKRWNNVINPDDICAEYGADAFRVYEMFMGPFDQPVAWNTNGVVGARKFLQRLAMLSLKVGEDSAGRAAVSLLHKTIIKVSGDIVDFKFNTAISALMILVNKLSDEPSLTAGQYAMLLQLAAPFAPHLAEELWQEQGQQRSIFLSAWPVADESLTVDEQVTVVVQINGKVRDSLEVAANLPDAELETMAKAQPKILPWLEGKDVVKVIVVPNKLVNIVIS